METQYWFTVERILPVERHYIEKENWNLIVRKNVGDM
jgi:hypothetical protein